MSGRLSAGLLPAVLLLALGLRLIHLGHESLWQDEVFSWMVSHRPPVDPFHQPPDPPHPPLYFLMLHQWIQWFGSGEAALRSLSVVWGVAAVGMLFLLGRRLAGPLVGLLAATALAVLPTHVFLSQEARMYATLSFTATAAAWFLLRYMDQRLPPNAISPWAGASLANLAGLAAVCLLGIFTHFYMGLVVLVLGLYYLAGCRWCAAWRRGLGAWLASQAVVILVFVPYLPTFIRQVSENRSAPEAARFAHPNVLLSALAWPLTRFAATEWIGVATGLGLVCLIVLSCLPKAGAWGGRLTPPRWRQALPLFWLLATLLVVATAGRWVRLVHVRALLVIWPPMLLAAAMGVAGLRRRAVAAAAGAALVLGLGHGLAVLYAGPEVRPLWRELAQWVRARAQAGDVLVFQPRYLHGFRLYYDFGVRQWLQTPWEKQGPAWWEYVAARLGEEGPFTGQVVLVGLADRFPPEPEDPQRRFRLVERVCLGVHRIAAGIYRLPSAAAPSTAGSAAPAWRRSSSQYAWLNMQPGSPAAGSPK